MEGMLEPETERLLRLHVPAGMPVDWRQIDPGDNAAYWRLVAETWAAPGPTLIVEQDIGIRAGVIEELTACPEPWCGFGYPIDGSTAVCLGCTRFAAALKEAEPDLLGVVGEVGNDGLPAKDWRRLDVRILDALRSRGYSQHRHFPNVQHFHKYADRR